MKDIGISVEHIALMYAVLPFTIFLAPPLVGFMADKLVRFVISSHLELWNQTSIMLTAIVWTLMNGYPTLKNGILWGLFGKCCHFDHF